MSCKVRNDKCKLCLKNLATYLSSAFYLLQDHELNLSFLNGKMRITSMPVHKVAMRVNKYYSVLGA